VTEGEWVAFLAGNSVVALVLIGIDVFLLRATRAARWSRAAAYVAIAFGALGAALFVIPSLSRPADIAVWVWAWGIAMSAAFGFGVFLLLPSVCLAAFAVVVRLRRSVG
jgi:undecaprenyl pyrophosphate phosphatase UppP